MKSAYLLKIYEHSLAMFAAWKEPSTISRIYQNLTRLLHKLGNMAGTGATNQPQGYQITLDKNKWRRIPPSTPNMESPHGGNFEKHQRNGNGKEWSGNDQVQLQVASKSLWSAKTN